MTSFSAINFSIEAWKRKTGVKTQQCRGSRKTKKKESHAYLEHLQVQFYLRSTTRIWWIWSFKNSRRKTPVHADPPLRQLLCNNHLLIGTQNSNNRRQNWTRARKIDASTTDCAGVELAQAGGNTKRGRRREEKRRRAGRKRWKLRK